VTATTTRQLLLVAALALAAALLVIAASGPNAAAANPKLFAEVGTQANPETPSITFKDAGGNAVTSIPAGTYDVQVDDWATTHNFDLTMGTTVIFKTSIEMAEHTTKTVTFSAGNYHFQCDVHSFMSGDFTVTAPPPPPSSWTTPKDASGTDSTGFSDPKVGIDGNGKAVILWQKTSNSTVQYRTRSATGTLGSTVALDTGGGPGAPQLAVNKVGTVAFTWLYNDGMHTLVRARTLKNGVLSAKQTISSTSSNSSEPDVAIDDAGNAYFVWSTGGGGVQARKRDTTGALTSIQDISPGGGGPGRPQISANATGDAWFMWLQKTGSFTVAKARKRATGGTLGDVKTLSSTSQNSLAPQVGATDAGNAVFAWTLASGANQGRRFAGGTLSGVYSLSPTGAGGQVQVAVNRVSGSAGFVWRHTDGTRLRAQSRTLSAGGTLGTLKTLSAAGADAVGPQVGIDSSSNLVFLWRRNAGIQAVTQSSGGALGTVKDVTTAAAIGFPALAVSGNGKAVAVWIKQVSPTDFRVQVSAGP
jgi:hypothetical protein